MAFALPNSPANTDFRLLHPFGPPCAGFLLSAATALLARTGGGAAATKRGIFARALTQFDGGPNNYR